MTARKIGILISLALMLGVSSLHSRARKIMRDEVRNECIQNLESLLHYEDEELRDRIQYVTNPFFFEQPLLLKLRAPGGVKDQDLLRIIGNQLIHEISGAFIRGSRRSLLMKSGMLIKEGDTITRKVESFGGIETTVVVESIDREKFVLRLNNAVFTVDLTEAE